MISLTSVWAVVLRQMRMWKRDPNLILMGLYWPLLDILIWGFLGSWLQSSHSDSGKNYQAIALLSILLWQVIGRGCNYMCYTLNEELWSNNVINLFSLPLRITEWMCGALIFSAIMMTITTVVSMIVIASLYDISMWYIVVTFLIFAPPLFLSSIWVGFSCLSIIVTLGKRSSELAFVCAWFLMPFCGAFYPIDVLPRWGQAISTWLPMSYVFQGMREYLTHHQSPTTCLMTGYALSVLYATCAVALFIYCFNRTKQKGLARLVD